jgi:L-iditol 2-dehydrogenase
VAGNYVRVKIHTAPMCTEFSQYRQGQVSESIGHEAAGEVVETAGPVRVKVGDRVAVMPLVGCGQCELCIGGDYIHCEAKPDPLVLCNTRTGVGTYAEYCIQQDWLLMKIPDDLSYDEASMACCGLGPTFNAMQLMQVNSLDTVLISGLGPVGLGGAVNALVRGARVIGIEANGYRAELAKSMGAEAVVSPTDPDALKKILDLTKGRGADKSVETSSAKTAPAFLVDATRCKGQITSVGWGGPVNFADIVRKGLSIHGAWHWNPLRDREAMIRTIRKARPFLAKSITHRFPMSKVKDAWELQLTGQSGKVLLHPWG